MKNRNLILSVLLWAVCSCLFAVTLPSSSYQFSLMSNGAENENIILGNGTKYIQIYKTSANENWGNECWKDSEGNEKLCLACCREKLYECTSGDCLVNNEECVGVCHNGPSLPLGSSLLLLPFIGIYAVIRKRKEAVMA